MKHLNNAALILLYCVVVLSAVRPGFGQTSAPRGGNLRIVVLAGQGATNSISTRQAIEPVVEVRDDNEMPVASADVTFTLPQSGAGGSFPGGNLTLDTSSNAQGQAAGKGFTPNDIAGSFAIKVTAVFGERRGETTIRQTNSMVLAPTEVSSIKKKSNTSKILWIVGLAAGAGAGAAIALGGGGGSSSTVLTAPPSIVFVPGQPTVGGPR